MCTSTKRLEIRILQREKKAEQRLPENLFASTTAFLVRFEVKDPFVERKLELSMILTYSPHTRDLCEQLYHMIN